MGPEADRDTPAQVLIVDDDTDWAWLLEERLSTGTLRHQHGKVLSLGHLPDRGAA